MGVFGKTTGECKRLDRGWIFRIYFQFKFPYEIKRLWNIKKQHSLPQCYYLKKSATEDEGQLSSLFNYFFFFTLPTVSILSTVDSRNFLAAGLVLSNLHSNDASGRCRGDPNTVLGLDVTWTIVLNSLFTIHY